MELTVIRQPSSEDCTLGELLVDGEHACYTLEDPIREVEGEPVSRWKVPGQTAIPAGRYRVTITPSQHFGRPMPLINDVPGFVGVRIHAGNTASDTEGCLLVGEAQGPDRIGRSAVAFAALFERIRRSLASGDAVWISYENPQ
ncbi:DUF5675 family protein [Chitinimonas sp.]|uniref:DUF5675 family protein n=1 Tax=Chitinimonas sp. TaxID=1934313 RepID=UPI0035AF4B55